MAQQTEIRSTDSIDFKRFILKVLANWFWFVITIFIGLVIAYYINRYSDPIFKVSTSLVVREKNNTLLGIESIYEDLGIYRRKATKKTEEEIAILKTYDLAKQTLLSLNFQISYFSIGRVRTPELYPQSSPIIVKIDTAHKQLYNIPFYVTVLNDNSYFLEIESKNVRKNLKFGQQYTDESNSFSILFNNNEAIKNNQNKFYFIINDIDQLATLYKNKVTAAPAEKQSSIIVLSSQGTVAQKESDYLNMLVETYFKNNLQEKNQIAVNTINFINDQLIDITDSLTTAENTLQDFRLANNIVDISKEGQIILEKLTDLEKEKAGYLIRSKYFEYLINYIKSKNEDDVISPSTMNVNDATLTNLVNQLTVQLEKKRALVRASKDNTPLIWDVNNNISLTKQSINECLSNITNLNDISIAEVNSRIKIVYAQISTLPGTERQFINIQRVYTLNDEIYTYLLKKRAEAGITKASNTPDNRWLDKALVKDAVVVSPKATLNYLIAVLLSILIPIIFILLQDFFNNRILERSDIEGHTKVPIIGAIGHNNKGSDLVVYDKPKSSIAESFRTLRTNIQYLSVDKPAKNHVISVTSTVSGEGKTFCAINIASIFAMSSRKTLIIGLDLRKPKIHKDFKIVNDTGISTYLIGKNTLEEIIKPTEIENLFFIPSGPVPPNPAELIETVKMQQLLQILKEQFEYIIIDTPPVALVTDALLLSRQVDTNIFVIRQNYTTKSVLRLLNDLYEEKNLKSLCILINDVKVPSYYGYKYGYGYRYGGYTYQYNYGYGYGYGYGYYEDDAEIDKPSIIHRILTFLKIRKKR